MPARFLGTYLIENHALKPDELLQATRSQDAIRLPLTAQAVSSAFLTDEQTDQLDAISAATGKTQLHSALETQVTDFTKIAELADQKTERWMFLAEALVRNGILSMGRLQRLIRGYLSENCAVDTRTDLILARAPQSAILSLFVRSTIEVFSFYTQSEAKVLSINTAPEPSPSDWHVFLQKVHGDASFSFILTAPDSVVLWLASRISGEQQHTLSALILDCACEFINTIVGRGCSSSYLPGYGASAEPPSVDAEGSGRITQGTVAVDLSCEAGNFRLLFRP